MFPALTISMFVLIGAVLTEEPRKPPSINQQQQLHENLHTKEPAGWNAEEKVLVAVTAVVCIGTVLAVAAAVIIFAMRHRKMQRARERPNVDIEAALPISTPVITKREGAVVTARSVQTFERGGVMGHSEEGSAESAGAPCAAADIQPNIQQHKPPYRPTRRHSHPQQFPSLQTQVSSTVESITATMTSRTAKLEAPTPKKTTTTTNKNPRLLRTLPTSHQTATKKTPKAETTAKPAQKQNQQQPRPQRASVQQHEKNQIGCQNIKNNHDRQHPHTASDGRRRHRQPAEKRHQQQPQQQQQQPRQQQPKRAQSPAQRKPRLCAMM